MNKLMREDDEGIGAVRRVGGDVHGTVFTRHPKIDDLPDTRAVLAAAVADQGTDQSDLGKFGDVMDKLGRID